jgi:transcriptional regulator with XRE-family HTH domain
MIHNKPFVDAIKKEQRNRRLTQAEFARWIGISQGALSKFYKRGVKDSVVTLSLAKLPDLAVFFAQNDSDCT